MVDASREARQWGVHAGMPVTEARGLGRRRGAASRSATLRCVACDPQADREALERLSRMCHAFSPLVGREPAEPADSLLLDLTGLAPGLGSEAARVQQVHRALVRRGYRVRMALADTIGAAWGIAHFADGAAGRPLVVRPGEGADRLARLPPAALRLPAGLSQLLARLGIERIGQLMQLPRSELAARFDRCLLMRLDQALGSAAEAIAAERPEAELVVERSLEFSIDRREGIERLMAVLIRQLCEKLLACGRGALQLTVRLECPLCAPVTFRAELFRPTASARHLQDVMGLHLERLRLPAPVAGVCLHVTASGSQEPRQKRLFADDPSMPDPRRFARLVDRLAGRLGRGAVRAVRRTADAQPERACHYLPLVAAGQRRRSAPLPADRPGPLERPLWLVPRPRPLDVVAVVPLGPPVRFRLEGTLHQVARHWGPERIETGWWRQQPVRRDYYRVETTTGARFWLFRSLRNAQWFLHGMF